MSALHPPRIVPMPAAPAARPSPTAPARFVHARGTGPLDDAALEAWWTRFGDGALDAAVGATLRQNAELSLSTLYLLDARARLEVDEGEAADIAAWTALGVHQALRVRLLAQVARLHFRVLALQERAACADRSLAERATLLRGAREGDDDARRLRHPMLAELHAFRIRLHGERDVALVALAELTGEPLDVVDHRVRGAQLPAAAPELPAAGDPAALLRRRPEVVATRIALQLHGGAGAARALAVEHDRLGLHAVAEVERAYVALSSLRDELAPVRARALAAEADCRDAARAPAAHGALRVHAEALRHAACDREIELRGLAYAGLVNVFEALGGGWPTTTLAGGAA